MSGKIKASRPDAKTATRLPLFNQRGHKMKSGDVFKVTGKNNWWRFIAYVIPVHGDSYVEAVELKQKGKEVPGKNKDGARGAVKNGATRCLDASRVREVG